MVMRASLNNIIHLNTIICISVFFLTAGSLFSQQSGNEYFYRISFRDKGENTAGNFSPESLISERALKRRQKAGVPLVDYRDIPVSQEYIDQLTAMGLALHCSSRWMNTGLFMTDSRIDMVRFSNLPFISGIKAVKEPAGKSLLTDKLNFSTSQDDISSFERPISMVNGIPLQNSGYLGKGILIAVTDGGFYNADVIQALDHLHNRKGVVATYDFVERNEFVYGFHNHGTAVLSVLAGKIPGKIAGTAPGADYLLLRTEDTTAEYPAEEDYWVAAAEYADSAGADIISSSLGYYIFDNPAFNYKFSDLDGNTAFITRAADIAASKGILVVCSAGNERDNDWKRIIAPSDGDSVIAVGAVDRDRNIAPFSSAGPSADGRTKPDNVAMGVGVPVQIILNSVVKSNGTSFSCPVVSGMAACLMQAVPKAKNTDIINALHLSSDKFTLPDTLCGYGIPDVTRAVIILQDKYIEKPENETAAGPNPFISDLRITFRQVPDYLVLEIYTISGILVTKRDYSDFIGRELIISDTGFMDTGLYIVKLTTGKGTFIHKVIKMNKR
jgi:hypothetical protein